MQTGTGNRWFKRLSFAAVAAVALAGLTVPLTPAKAQFYFGIGPGGIDFGVGAPTPYYYPYYRDYYRPYYYYGW